jgi:hypothetical protein
MQTFGPFFDNLAHEWLVKFIEHRITDRRILLPSARLERRRPLLLAFVQFHFGIRHGTQTCLPFGFQSACDETVFRIHAA